MAFGRIRVRLDDAVPGATYEIVHPYGVVRATADDGGRLFYTDDNGCMNGPCGFERLLTQPVGPFLRWDDGAPEGYVGDPSIEHTVTGSPFGTNEFTVTQVTDGDGDPISPDQIGSTDLFAVQGKLAGPGVMASQQTGTFADPLQVTLTGNARTTQIRFTLDGSIPTATSGQVYDGPITIGEGSTTLNYLAVGDGVTSRMETETYTVTGTAPTLNASVAGGEFDSAQDVTLTTDDPTATIRFTLDGSEPGADSAVFTGGTIRIESSLTLRAVATDPAGNSTAQSWSYTITPPTGGGTTGGGTTGGGTGATTGGTPAGGTTAGGTPAGGTATPPGPAQAPTAGVLLQRGTVGALDAGGVTTLSGVLAPNGAALAGKKVVLQARSVTTSGRALGAFATVATKTTDAAGRFAFTGLKPQATTAYRVVYSGGASDSIVSATRQVTVRAVVSLSQPARRIERGQVARFRGKLGSDPARYDRRGEARRPRSQHQAGASHREPDRCLAGDGAGSAHDREVDGRRGVERKPHSARRPQPEPNLPDRQVRDRRVAPPSLRVAGPLVPKHYPVRRAASRLSGDCSSSSSGAARSSASGRRAHAVRATRPTACA